MPKHPVQSHALTGYVYRDQPRASVPSGIFVQAPDTFSFRQVDLAQSATAVEFAAIVTELGIPWTALLYTLTLDPPQGWPGMRYELVGTRADVTDPPDAPAFLDQFSYWHPQIIRPWRRRIRSHTSPLYLEVLWSPGREETIDIRGVHQDRSLTGLPGIQDAMRLLEGVRGIGRPRGTRYYTREAFHAAWPAKVVEAQRRRDGPVRQEDLARAYRISTATLSRYLRDYGRPQP
jgi:hypothetical protein